MTSLDIDTKPILTHRISRYLHSTFFEYFGTVIYDGIWVGKDSPIPNIGGIRKDVIDGCREAGIRAARWPGGCCADHYHFMDGIGFNRMDRIHPMPTISGIWRHEFGTDEFIRFCRLTGAEPIIVANTATGTCGEFLDWFEYCNGPVTTRYGSLRAENGHPEPYRVRIWGLGNTDENVWYVDYNNPVAYSQSYRKFVTVIRELRKDLKIIGLGLSERHNMPGWAEKSLDYITSDKRSRGPDSLSVHHYIGGGKGGRYAPCGDGTDYSDEEYYYTLDCLKYYQKDIDLHRRIIAEHTRPADRTTICFDEWGLHHPEAQMENGIRHRQTMRDAIFAACSFHVFYRNSDIVEYAMETQLCNLLQSLFETDGPSFCRTPTFYVFKLYKEHLDQYLVESKASGDPSMLDIVSSIRDDGLRMTVTAVNKDLYNPAELRLFLPEEGWRIERSDLIATENVRSLNRYDNPLAIADKPLKTEVLSFKMPPHSIAGITLAKSGGVSS